jgi:alcohol dehydrogenase class IV
MSADLTANWNYPTSIRFGPGRIRELPDACKDLGIAKPLLVTDPGIASLPILTSALEANQLAGIPTAVFSEVQGNPIGANVTAGVQAFRSGAHDGVIAMGGGSALDAGKAIALMVGQDRPLWDFEDVGANWKRVNTELIAPVVAIPTTSGTGSEVGRASVILDQTTAVKRIIFHPSMLPSRVICDPALTVGLPPSITAAVGMDALSHNLEAFCATGNHPQADGIAIEGMRLVQEHLITAYTEPTNIVARSGMMSASLMGATAFQKGLGAMHSMAHVIGAQLHAHHGLINAVVMPYVLCANRAAIAEQMGRLGRYLDLPQPSFMSVLDWVLALRSALQIPHTLADLGVTHGHVDTFAPAAVLDPSTGSNPLPFGTAEFAGLFHNAIDGTLT